MLLLYNIGIQLYDLSVNIAAFFNPKAMKWVSGRIGLLDRIENKLSDFQGETVWVHCASLGEFEMARPIMEGIRDAQPATRIVLTFFSPSGYEIRKEYEVADHVFYLPVDTRSNALKFIGILRPDIVIFVKYDLWFHYLEEAKNAGAELLLISAQFRREQQYFKFYGGIGRRALKLFDRIFLVDGNSKELLHSIGIRTGIVCGDTRYDRAMQVAGSVEQNTKIERLKGSSKLIVCGSTRKEDELLLAEAVKKLPDVKWAIAPHEVDEENIERLENLFKDTVRYSQVENPTKPQIMVIDGVGLLNKLYRYADVAYVGGGFKKGGLHNILEATAFGVPTVFGPDKTRFPDAKDMVKGKLAFSIGDQQELNDRFTELLYNDQSDLKEQILSFMKRRIGATSAILSYLKIT